MANPPEPDPVPSSPAPVEHEQRGTPQSDDSDTADALDGLMAAAPASLDTPRSKLWASKELSPNQTWSPKKQQHQEPPTPVVEDVPKPEKISDKKRPFWERFDTHIKRWQSVAALIVALGVIIGFVGFKMEWHWPTWDAHETLSPPPTTSVRDRFGPDGISLRARFQDKTWKDKIDVDGISPTFQVQAGYLNLTDHVERGVLLNYNYDGRLIPIRGTGMIKNGNNPDAATVDDSAIGSWLNIGDYNADAAGFVIYTFTLHSLEFPCGDTTMTIRASVIHEEDADLSKIRNSPEAVVVYHKDCEAPA
jgi:hypothetical protein